MSGRSSGILKSFSLMHFKHLSIGAIFIAVGIAILSPFDDIIILIPASMVFGIEIFPAVFLIGAICVAVGIFLVGKSTLMHYGFVGKAIAHHPAVILGFIGGMCAFLYWWIVYGT